MKHYEARIRDLDIELFQQRNLNKKLEDILRQLIKKFKKQKNKIKDELARVSSVKAELEADFALAEEAIQALDSRGKKAAEKAKRHKKKHLKFADKSAVCEKDLEVALHQLQEALLDIDFFEDSMGVVVESNVFLHNKLFYTREYLRYCKPTLKERFKQWWTGIHYIYNLRDKM